MNAHTHQNINVGVDTGKTKLDIYIRPLDIFFTVSNDEQGIQKLSRPRKPHEHPRHSTLPRTLLK